MPDAEEPAQPADASADVEFLIALVGWERDASRENTLRLHSVFLGVVDAWREVARGHDFRPLETQ